jgi:hypothetical protein
MQVAGPRVGPKGGFPECLKEEARERDCHPDLDPARLSLGALDDSEHCRPSVSVAV